MRFQQPDAFTRVQFRLYSGPDLLMKWFERSDLNPSPMRFGGHLAFHDRIAIRSQKHVKWPDVDKQPVVYIIIYDEKRKEKKSYKFTSAR